MGSELVQLLLQHRPKKKRVNYVFSSLPWLYGSATLNCRKCPWIFHVSLKEITNRRNECLKKHYIYILQPNPGALRYYWALKWIIYLRNSSWQNNLTVTSIYQPSLLYYIQVFHILSVNEAHQRQYNTWTDNTYTVDVQHMDTQQTSLAWVINWPG